MRWRNSSETETSGLFPSASKFTYYSSKQGNLVDVVNIYGASGSYLIAVRRQDKKTVFEILPEEINSMLHFPQRRVFVNELISRSLNA